MNFVLIYFLKHFFRISCYITNYYGDYWCLFLKLFFYKNKLIISIFIPTHLISFHIKNVNLKTNLLEKTQTVSARHPPNWARALLLVSRLYRHLFLVMVFKNWLLTCGWRWHWRRHVTQRRCCIHICKFTIQHSSMFLCLDRDGLT